MSDSRGRRLSDLTPADLSNKGFVRAYIKANPFEFWIGMAAVVTAVVFATSPSALRASAIGEQSGVLAYVWAGLYGCGGAALTSGFLLITRPVGWRLEVAGLWILAAGMTANAFSIIVEHSFVGAATTLSYLGLAASSLLRSRSVLQLQGVGRK